MILANIVVATEIASVGPTRITSTGLVEPVRTIDEVGMGIGGGAISGIARIAVARPTRRTSTTDTFWRIAVEDIGGSLSCRWVARAVYEVVLIRLRNDSGVPITDLAAPIDRRTTIVRKRAT